MVMSRLLDLGLLGYGGNVSWSELVPQRYSIGIAEEIKYNQTLL